MDLLIGSQRFQQDSSVAQRTNRRAHPLIRARYSIAWTGFAVRSFNAVTTYPSVAGNSVGIGIERIKDAVVRTLEPVFSNAADISCCMPISRPLQAAIYLISTCVDPASGRVSADFP